MKTTGIRLMPLGNYFASVLAGIALAIPAVAQDTQEGILDEIVVMAQKREQTLQEVPIAVSVITADVMQKAQINDVLDLQSVVPSLRVTQLQSSGQTNFVIRGFGNGANNPGIEPSVGVFIDGVYRSRSASALADLPNLERVEVLRGPQSTLFGKNASAGVINVVTAAPSLDEAGGSASLVYGNYNQVIVKGDFSVPLSETFAVGLSGSYNERDGYFTNLANGSELNGRDRWGVRGQALWQPSDTLSFRLIADKDEFDEICCGVGNIVAGPTTGVIMAVGGQIVPAAPFAREQYYDFDPTNKVENSGVSLQADWDITDSVLLTSITASRDQSRMDNVDVDFTSAALLQHNTGDTQIDTFSQELRLSGATDSTNWMLGGYYFDETVNYDNDIAYDAAFRPYGDILAIIASGGTPGVDPSPLAIIEGALMMPPGTFLATGQGTAEFSGQDDETLSLFGQFDFSLTDRMTVTLGANYTKVDKNAYVSQNHTDVFSSVPLDVVGGGLVGQQVGAATYAGTYAALIAAGVDPVTADAQATAAATHAAAAAAATAANTDCTPTSGPICNPLLPLTALQFLPPAVVFPNSVEDGKSSDSKTTWTARIAYDVNDNMNMYFSAGTGFKATSWNLSRDTRPFEADIPAIVAAGLAVPNMTAGTRFAAPENSTVYELGLKSNWSANWLNVAAFYQEIEGFQSNIFTGTGFSLVNAGKQSTYGVEIDSVFIPVDPLTIAFALTWLDPTYDSFVGAEGVGGIVDLSGTRPAGIHEWSTNLSGTYDFDVGASMSGFIRAEWIYESEVQVIENVPESVASREVNVINASIGLSLTDNIDAMIWGRNLTDDDYLISAFPAVAQAGSYSGYPNQPRTYGITLTAWFD
jgi:iron complex outermembrane receptor protein